MACRLLPASVTCLKIRTTHTRRLTATLDAQARTRFASHLVVYMRLEKLLTEDDTTGSMPRVDDCPAAALCREEGIMAMKMFQSCGSATLSESGRTINAREGNDDYPSAALPLLPRDRYCQAWAVA